MVIGWRRRTPHRFACLCCMRAQKMEELIMASIADLTTAVDGLSDVEQRVLAVLTAPPAGGTVLSADDQAALDAAVASVNEVASNLSAALPAATEPPAGDGGDSTGASTPVDGTVA